MKDFPGMHIHFVGIGGIGMSGIARVLVELGYKVSGSDLSETRLTKRLQEKGIEVYHGHSAGNIQGADMVVVSSAIPADNPEVREAHARKVSVVLRAEMLGFLMRNRFGIAVAGTHGKTTTTSMVAFILENAGRDPTVVVGGEVHNFGHNAKLGKSSLIVVEADESDASFLKLSPQIAVVTNIDADVNPSAGAFALLQFDYEKMMCRIEEIFLEFLQRIPPEGHAILCWDCPNLKRLKNDLSCRVLTYGLGEGADLTAADIQLKEIGGRFRVHLHGKLMGEVSLKVPGEHNVLNALAAIGASLQVDVPFSTAQKALADFEGVRRRFEILGETRGILVVDDYAHNPTKIKATLVAAKAGWNRRTVAVFQPHRFTRTKFLKKEFIHAFEQADLLIVTEIYSAGEEPIPGVTGESLALEIRQAFPEKAIWFLPGEKEILKKLIEETRSGDIVITLGAGDIHRVGSRFLESLHDGAT